METGTLALCCYVTRTWLECRLRGGRSGGPEVLHFQWAPRHCPLLWLHSQHLEEPRFSPHTGFLASTTPSPCARAPTPSGSISPPPWIWAACGSENPAG